jgi:hypothetical protein
VTDEVSNEGYFTAGALSLISKSSETPNEITLTHIEAHTGGLRWKKTHGIIVFFDGIPAISFAGQSARFDSTIFLGGSFCPSSDLILFN